jgi:hypothetical protein
MYDFQFALGACVDIVKWSEVHLGEVYMEKSEVSTSVVKWSEV